ncbi:CpaF family protein [Ferrimonas pelagia]|uniref:CpaF family protein n=1 Tax=Ferrimonas pelagia TaxID=1177826 RepID=A0ABP9FHJ4_9GAMM
MVNAKHIFTVVREHIFQALEAEAIEKLSREQLSKQLDKAVELILQREDWSVPLAVRQDYVKSLLDELLGLGPLQDLMDDDSVSDVMINGHQSVFIERKGMVEKTPVEFVDEKQLLTIAKRIAGQVGRRIDDSQAMCDARLVDGSRVNIIIPPLAIDGTVISIRKFKKGRFGLDKYCEFGSMTPEMAKLLSIAARCRLNILISGGTGSGKTTLLNALSGYISDRERIVTIEDAAELQLQQPHVVRLETRAPSVENTGAVNQRDLVINALRMRPDRIIVGECRGGEAFEMLQAMNTGHDGSMSTLHANSPRDAIARVESMVMMATNNLPLDAIRRTIVSAIDLIVQVSRLHDGSRKIMNISEVIGLEGDSVVLEEIYRFVPNHSASPQSMIAGDFVTHGLMKRSVLLEKSAFFGLHAELTNAMRPQMEAV